jgi:glutamine synthetase adenylyltransferase
MNISENYKAFIVNEINFVINKMDGSKTAEDKIYYFSAINAVFQRIFNIEYDPTLVFAFIILRDTHTHFLQRLQSRKQGETSVLLTEEHLSRLSDLTRELLSKIERNENIDDTLKKYVILYYSTTGNGYYLFQKGLIQI